MRPSGVVVMNLAHTSGQVGIGVTGDGHDRTGWVCLSRPEVVLDAMVVDRQRQTRYY